MYYFYCPNCKKEDEVDKRPDGTMPNIRDGFGPPIYHYECPDCHNLDAGFMEEKTGCNNEKEFYRVIIGMYQGVRGFSTQEDG